MACPTCDHTMETIGIDDRGDSFLLCPRCGTVVVDAFGQHGDRVYVPKLVGRCREFAAQEYAAYSPEKGHGVVDAPPRWRAIGIAESINLPTERK